MIIAITHRCLELVLHFMPLLKEFYNKKLIEKQINSDKQFSLLIKVNFIIQKNC